MANNKDVAAIADRLAAQIIQVANDGYHQRDDYPPYSLVSWDDRPRWSDYIKRVAAEVIKSHLEGRADD